MNTGVIGYFDLVGTKGMTLRVHYEETYDFLTAQRTVAITSVQLSAQWYPAVYYLNGTISIDGVAAVVMDSGKGTHNVNASPTNEFRSMNGEMGSVSGIGSNDDGTKSITISASVRGYTKDGEGGGNAWSVEGSQAVTLTQINRGLVHIDAGDGFEAYSVYIDNGTDWDQYIPYIGNGTSWDMCS